MQPDLPKIDFLYVDECQDFLIVDVKCMSGMIMGRGYGWSDKFDIQCFASFVIIRTASFGAVILLVSLVPQFPTTTSLLSPSALNYRNHLTREHVPF